MHVSYEKYVLRHVIMKSCLETVLILFYLQVSMRLQAVTYQLAEVLGRFLKGGPVDLLPRGRKAANTSTGNTSTHLSRVESLGDCLVSSGLETLSSCCINVTYSSVRSGIWKAGASAVSTLT